MLDQLPPSEPPARHRPGLLLPALTGCAGGGLGVLLAGALVLLLAVGSPTLVARLGPTPAPTITPAPTTAPTPQAAAADPVRDAPVRIAREVGPAVVTVVSQLP